MGGRRDRKATVQMLSFSLLDRLIDFIAKTSLTWLSSLISGIAGRIYNGGSENYGEGVSDIPQQTADLRLTRNLTLFHFDSLRLSEMIIT